MSHIITFFKPLETSSLVIAIPAEPAPFTTALISVISLPTTFRALSTDASTTTAVPCWSSWNTGISHSSLNLLSISIHLGADISSRLTPPNEPAIILTVFTISSTSFERTQSGNASTSANTLNNAHLPSITGIPASGPISPSPSTAVPSVITATRFERLVYLYDKSTSFEISRQGSATPGVYATESSSLFVTFALDTTSILPCQSSCCFSANSFLSISFSPILSLCTIIFILSQLTRTFNTFALLNSFIFLFIQSHQTNLTVFSKNMHNN